MRGMCVSMRLEIGTLAPGRPELEWLFTYIWSPFISPARKDKVSLRGGPRIDRVSCPHCIDGFVARQRSGDTAIASTISGVLSVAGAEQQNNDEILAAFGAIGRINGIRRREGCRKLYRWYGDGSEWFANRR